MKTKASEWWRGDRCGAVTDIYIITMLSVFPLFTGFSGYANLTFSKYIFFVGAAALWLLTLSALCIKERRGLTLTPARGAVLMLAVFCCVSFALSPWKGDALVGSGRFDGLITLLLYCGIFIGVSAFARPKESYAVAFALFISANGVISLLQLLGMDPLWLFPGEYTYYDAGLMYSGVFLGTLGNMNITSSVLCFAAPLFLGLFCCGGRKRDALYLVPACLSVFCLFAARSDSGILALCVCALVGAPIVITDFARLRRALAGFGAFSLSAALALAFKGGFRGGEFSFAFEFSAFSRLFLAAGFAAEILALLLGIRPFSPGKKLLRRFFCVFSLLAIVLGLLFAWFYPGTEGPVFELSQLLHGRWDDSYGSSRLLIWRGCMELAAESPLFGGGPGTLPLRLDIEFSRYVEETGKTLSTYVDNAHNEYLGYLVNTGALSLLAYVAAIFFAFSCWLRRSAERFPAAAGLGLCACCVQAFFGLGLFVSAPIFWIFLALMLSGQAPINFIPWRQP